MIFTQEWYWYGDGEDILVEDETEKQQRQLAGCHMDEEDVCRDVNMILE